MQSTQPATSNHSGINATETQWQPPEMFQQSLVHRDDTYDNYDIDRLSMRLSNMPSVENGQVYDTFFAGRLDEDDDMDDADEEMLEEVASDSPPSRMIMLSALKKANSAVLLDNDGNIEGAKMAYIEACNLLQIVIGRANKAEYRAKLRKIYDVYGSRVSELSIGSASASDGSASIPNSPMPSLSSSRIHPQSLQTSLSSELPSRRSSLVYAQDVGIRSNKDSSALAFRDVFSSEEVPEYTEANDILATPVRWHRSMNVRGSSSSMSSASGAVSPLTSMADRGNSSRPSSPSAFTPTTADTLRTNNNVLQFYDSDTFFEPLSPTFSITEGQFETVGGELREAEDIIFSLDYLLRNNDGQLIPIAKSLALFHKSTEDQVKADMSVSQVLQEFDVDIELAKAHFGHPQVRAIVTERKSVASQTDAEDTDAGSADVKEGAIENGLGLYYDKPLGQRVSTALIPSPVFRPASPLKSAASVQYGEEEVTDATEPDDISTPTSQSTATVETFSKSSPSRHRRVLSALPADAEGSPRTQALRRASSVNSSGSPLTQNMTATPKPARVTFLRSSSSPGSVKSSSSSRRVTSSLNPLISRTASSPSSSSNASTGAASPASATSLASPRASGSQFITSISSTSLSHKSKDTRISQSTSISSFSTIGTPFSPPASSRLSISTSARANTIRSHETPPLRPADPIARPFWLMRNIHTALTSPSGGLITGRLRLSPQIFLDTGVKLRSLEEKISACESMNCALLHFEDDPSVQGILDLVRVMHKIETRLQPILVPEGSDYTHGFGAFGDDFFTPTRKAAPATLHSGPGSDASSERSASVASESSSQKLLSWKKFKSWTVSGPKGAGGSTTSLAQSHTGTTNEYYISRKGSDGKDAEESLRGPLSMYANVLIVLFYRAQVIEQVPGLLSTDNLPTQTKARVDLAVRRASEFFGQVICKFVLADIGELMDKYVKRTIRGTLTA
ncbi:uncharacterized protein V1513DRAFT_446781 [Lipomyces chichibuensis]|uniref:uncharacterized protein n=1 Tax=Lipomyces chichibuensis TaxID=1546026 RepID=UPI00334369B1